MKIKNRWGYNFFKNYNFLWCLMVIKCTFFFYRIDSVVSYGDKIFFEPRVYFLHSGQKNDNLFLDLIQQNPDSYTYESSHTYEDYIEYILIEIVSIYFFSVFL